MSQPNDELSKRIDSLIEKIQILTMVLATKPNSEQMNSQLRNKPQKEQIRILKEFNLPPEIIALIIGSTLNSTRVAISEMKTAKSKSPDNAKTKPKGEQKNE
jgi:hypothetical protein